MRPRQKLSVERGAVCRLLTRAGGLARRGGSARPRCSVPANVLHVGQPAGCVAGCPVPLSLAPALRTLIVPRKRARRLRRHQASATHAEKAFWAAPPHPLGGSAVPLLLDISYPDGGHEGRGTASTLTAEHAHPAPHHPCTVHGHQVLVWRDCAALPCVPPVGAG